MWVRRKLGGGKISVKFRRMLKIFQNTYANVGIKSITKQKVKMHLKFSSKNNFSEMCMYPKQNWFSALSFFYIKNYNLRFRQALKIKWFQIAEYQKNSFYMHSTDTVFYWVLYHISTHQTPRESMLYMKYRSVLYVASFHGYLY